jgi:alpha-L-rhamnosidase
MSATCAGDAGGGCAFYSATYAIDFVLDVYQYYLYTGDEAFLRAEWPMVQRELAWEGSQVDPLNGLFMTTPADSADWAVEFSHPAGDYAAPSILHYESLLNGGSLAATLGDASDAQAYVAAAAAEKAAINSNLWDGALGAYDASTVERGWLVQDANVWAVLYGVASPSESQTILTNLAAKLTVPYGMLDFAAGAGPDYTEHLVSPYIGSFALWADYQEGRPDLALSLMRSEWGWMVNHDPGGVDWERIEAGGALAAADSAAHGWGTGATPALSQYVLGIQPVAPGFATWLVAPQPSGLRWAQGAVPTARGPLASRWIVGPRAKRFTLTVSAPQMTSGTVAVPLLGRPRTIAEDGRIVWNGSRAVGSSGAGTDGTAVDFPEVTGTHTWAW